MNYQDVCKKYNLVNLWNANLENANLWNANLRGANLRGADLWNADLRGADLENANLWNANLENANLENANLWNANLENANLRGANLWNTDLRGANLWNANLRGAKGIISASFDEREYVLVCWKLRDQIWFNAGGKSFEKRDALDHWGSSSYSDLGRGKRYCNFINFLADQIEEMGE